MACQPALRLATQRARARSGARGTFPRDDHRQHLVLRHVAGACGTNNAAVLHHADPVGEIEDIVQVMTDQEDADPLTFQFKDEVGDLA